jgi:hypothetical protein
VKKILPYILLGVVLIAVITLFLTGGNEQFKKFDERVTLRKQDKIPYGSYVAYEGLKTMFPDAAVTNSKQEPGFWDSLSIYDKDQALLIIAPYFNADEYEMKKLVSFAENGNDVFISTMNISNEAGRMMKVQTNSMAGMLSYFEESTGADRIGLQLASPPFGSSVSYSYPGKRYDFFLYGLDTTISTILGYDKEGKANFIQLKAGKGNVYLHLAPLAFSNYFLLYKNNISYLENVWSVISSDTKKIVWDEYFLSKKRNREEDNKNSNWLSVFMRYPGLKWGLLTALLTLLLYVLLEMRRKQRYIPAHKKPKNDSLDFVKTIGRLYHDKADHRNLCRKMAAYFLEHVRSRYKLPTTELNEEFIKSLQYKTGVDETEIRYIISFIKELEVAPTISDKQLAQFHQQLETFYKKA